MKNENNQLRSRTKTQAALPTLVIELKRPEAAHLLH
jgi:hypothetical protein